MCLASEPVICPVNTALTGMLSPKSHLRARRSVETSWSGLGLQPGCVHRASPAEESGCCKYPIDVILSSFPFLLTIALIHVQISLLFQLDFYNINKVPSPFEIESKAAVNLLFSNPLKN